MSAESVDVRLARIEEQLKTVYKQQEHIGKQQEQAAAQIANLVEVMNTGKGAYKAALLFASLAGFVGGLIGKFMHTYGTSP